MLEALQCNLPLAAIADQMNLDQIVNLLVEQIYGAGHRQRKNERQAHLASEEMPAPDAWIQAAIDGGGSTDGLLWEGE